MTRVPTEVVVVTEVPVVPVEESRTGTETEVPAGGGSWESREGVWGIRKVLVGPV